VTKVYAPMVGKIVSVDVKPGDKVKKNDVVATMEAMKMMIKVYAPADGEVKEVHVSVDDVVNTDSAIITIE